MRGVNQRLPRTEQQPTQADANGYTDQLKQHARAQLVRIMDGKIESDMINEEFIEEA